MGIILVESVCLPIHRCIESWLKQSTCKLSFGKLLNLFFLLGNLQWISNKPGSYMKQFWIQKLVTTGRESNEGYPSISIIKRAPSVPEAKLQIHVINYFSGNCPTQTLFFFPQYT